eukprot:15358859-Ditylum_brightwellii.AAC.2
MVTETQETLVECSVSAYGTALSFQAEEYGALSVVRFIHRLICYTDMEQMWEINLHMDNIGVMPRFNKQYEYEYDYSHNTLQPDWDVIAQLTADAKIHLKYFELFMSKVIKMTT